MTDTILLATKVPPAFLARLTARYEALGPLDPPFHETSRLLAPEEAGRVRAILSIGTVRIPDAALDLFPNLGLISCLGSGYEVGDTGCVGVATVYGICHGTQPERLLQLAIP